MEEGTVSKGKPGRWSGERGLAPVTAAIVMLIVVVLVGGVGYVAFNAVKQNPKTIQSCQPANSPACSALAVTHDVTLQTPFKTAQAGTVVPFSAILPSGETSNAFKFNFGDGTIVNSTTPATTHSYASPGTYIVSVTAVVSGTTHDNYHSLAVVGVTASYSQTSASNLPGVGGVITANSSTNAGATAILQPGGFVSVLGSYTAAPTNPLFSLAPPTITASSGATISNAVATNSTASAKVSFNNPGVYWVTFVGTASSSSGTPTTVHQNYIWSAFVAPSSVHAGAAGSAVTKSPHQGKLNIYELAPGGSTSSDPAVDYETVGYEPILNVYQSLVAYNGSSTGPTFASYVPQLATCVPGSPACQKLYGNSLSDGQNFTFVIDHGAQFYDPKGGGGSGTHWGVYPSDVVFSLARTMSFATLPCYSCNNGWIVTQALLPLGNSSSIPGVPTWDGGIHSARNNTPSHVFASMSVNDSKWCPATAMSAEHGCVTFHATGGGAEMGGLGVGPGQGLLWPYFLELIADNLGGSIVPCGWFSTSPQSAGIPGWTYGSAASAYQGDHPCKLPGGTTTTTDPAFTTAVNAIGATGWDTYQTSGSSPPFWGAVQWSMVGSGPYYLSNLAPAQSYVLTANPAYVQPEYCNYAGCEPAVKAYASQVTVTWETTQVQGEQAYASGVADFASIPSTDAALLLQLVQQGKIGALSFPSISFYFFPFDFAFNTVGAQRYTSNPITVQSDWFSHVGIRQFFAHAYPYQTIGQSINTKDGIQYYFNYGGAIPQFMANYYPTNVSWPSGDPVADSTIVGSAGWWWKQVTTVGTPWYTPAAAACSSSSPCELPMFGETGAPDLDQRIALWQSEVGKITNGAVKLDALDINFVDLVINSLFSGPYANAMPVYQLGWAPDYPDPTDYMAPMYVPDGSYTASDTVREQTTQTQFNASSCHTWKDYAYYAGLGTGAVTSWVSENCQGAAYAAMTLAMKIAATMPAGPARVTMYAMIEQIANQLALYIYWGQQNEVYTYASWINGTSINTNVTIGGGSDQLWYGITGNGL